jgi:hypothetical protein
MLPALRMAEIAKRIILQMIMDLMIWAGLR